MAYSIAVLYRAKSLIIFHRNWWCMSNSDRRKQFYRFEGVSFLHLASSSTRDNQISFPLIPKPMGWALGDCLVILNLTYSMAVLYWAKGLIVFQRNWYCMSKWDRRIQFYSFEGFSFLHLASSSTRDNQISLPVIPKPMRWALGDCLVILNLTDSMAVLYWA